MLPLLGAECLNLCGADSNMSSVLNLELEELRSKNNQSNQAGLSHKTELQSALEDNSCKDI